MTGHESSRVATGRFGLCGQCEHQQLVPNSRGSVFSLCRMSQVDSRFARYPRMPLLECPGFLGATAHDGDQPPAPDR